MTRGFQQAMTELERSPDEPVRTEVDGLVVELRLVGPSEARPSYDETMKRHLARGPVPLKAPGEGYPRREALYDRAGLR